VLRQLALHGLIGCLAAVLLGSIDFIDASLRISPYLHSIVQRLVLLMYFGLGPAVGLLIGLYVGLYLLLAVLVYQFVLRQFSRIAKPWLAASVAFAVQIVMFAIILNRVPAIHGYVIAQLREVEEIDEIRDQLLRHERLASDLVAIALLGSCTILWVLAR